MIRVMRLWRDGMATPVDSGLALGNLLRNLKSHTIHRYWIEDDRHPAVSLGPDWRVKSASGTSHTS